MRPLEALLACGTLTSAILLQQGCVSTFWSGSGTERRTHVERITEPAMREIPPPNNLLTDSRTSPSMKTELSSNNSTGLASELLEDVLFGFDQDSIREEALSVLDANIKHLQHHGVTHLVLEGRGDEVGTSAYNLVLGEHRARRVKSYLQQSRLSIDIDTTSFGKDRPLCGESTPVCMQQNRRVHFVTKP